MKKFISAFVVIAMMFSLAGTIGASAADVTVFVDGEQVLFDQPPVIENDRTLVPVRAIAEKLGAEVLWDDATRTATVKKDGNIVTMTIDNKIITKNGIDIEIDQPPVIRGSRTLIPARALAENLDCLVEWNPETYRVDVTTVTDEAFDTLKNFLLEEGTKIDDGYAIAVSAGDLFGEEYAAEHVYLGYSAVQSALLFGYVYEEEGNSGLVCIVRGNDNFAFVIGDVGMYYDITADAPKSSVLYGEPAKLKMATNNIASAYELETSVVEEFAGEMMQNALLDTEVLLEVLELGVTLKDLGFVNYVE